MLRNVGKLYIHCSVRLKSIALESFLESCNVFWSTPESISTSYVLTISFSPPAEEAMNSRNP